MAIVRCSGIKRAKRKEISIIIGLTEKGCDLVCRARAGSQSICVSAVFCRTSTAVASNRPTEALIIIIITLFESQIILAEHECCTNWGDCESNKSNQIKCWFLRRGVDRSFRRKTSRSGVENQQTQPRWNASC